MNKYLLILTGTAIMLLLCNGCFTGIESTPAITADDVQRAIARSPQGVTQPIVPLVDSVGSWRAGEKQFIVTDNQVRHLFAGTMPDASDTIDLTGRILTFSGYDTGDGLGNERNVNLHFIEGTHRYTIATGHTLDELSPRYRVPMLIDLDIVAAVDKQLRGKHLYIMTGLWYDCHSEQRRVGRQYVPVTVTAVRPGNKVLPLRVEFDWKGDTAMVWMSDGITLMPGRDFTTMFAEVDPHELHKSIDSYHWDLVTRGIVTDGMTKEECRLTLGAPRRTITVPDQQALRERWDYDGGSYLFFVDGRLQEHR